MFGSRKEAVLYLPALLADSICLYTLCRHRCPFRVDHQVAFVSIRYVVTSLMKISFNCQVASFSIRCRPAYPFRVQDRDGHLEREAPLHFDLQEFAHPHALRERRQTHFRVWYRRIVIAASSSARELKPYLLRGSGRPRVLSFPRSHFVPSRSALVASPSPLPPPCQSASR